MKKNYLVMIVNDDDGANVETLYTEIWPSYGWALEDFNRVEVLSTMDVLERYRLSAYKCLVRPESERPRRRGKYEWSRVKKPAQIVQCDHYMNDSCIHKTIISLGEGERRIVMLIEI